MNNIKSFKQIFNEAGLDITPTGERPEQTKSITRLMNEWQLDTAWFSDRTEEENLQAEIDQLRAKIEATQRKYQ